MSEEPELRAGPPWVMEEMIEAQRGLVAPVLGAPGAAALAEAVAAAVAAGEPVVLTGCGTSEHAAMGGAALLREALGAEAGARVQARDAFEAAADPQSGGVLVAVSHEAGTGATLAAARAAAVRGARTVLVTALPERAPAELPALATPLRDRSWCHTVGYLSPLLALHAVAAHLRGAPPAPEPVAAALDGVLARRRSLAERAGALLGCLRLLAVGGGADEITARELALKVEEGVHLPVTPLGPEKVLHGHLPACDARTGVVILRLDPRASAARDARAADVLAAARELRMPAVLVGADLLPPPPGLPPVAGALLGGALAAQLLTLALVHAAGTNPDLIRREEPPYRAAAEAAGAG
jgi:glucosamine--fructose-6-phosphate aminotransferase (isomerizing)